MTKPRRARQTQDSDLTQNEWAFLTDQDWPEPQKKWEVWALRADAMSFRAGRQSVAELWTAYGDEVLAEWIEEHPGTRPSLWWRFDAPRASREQWPHVCYDAASPSAQLRRRLGGVGTPCHEALAYILYLDHGVPAHWVSQAQSDLYNGRRKDTTGRVILAEYKDGDFPWPGVDPDNPPIYESEAAYLQHHALFAPGERERLTPDDFEPETIPLPEDDE